MRCLACDRRLNDRESTRKYATSGTFVDLCDRCFATVAEDIPDIEDGTVSPGRESEIDESPNENVTWDEYRDYMGYTNNDD